MEEPIGVREAAQVPRQRAEQLLEAAVRYTEERHWEVCPGTWLEPAGSGRRCSCGDDTCAAPGAHPAGDDWADGATGSGAAARRMWSRRPGAAVLLPTGRAFDAVDVPESAGFLALARLERMSLPLGPVTRTPDRRMQFFVLPGGAAGTEDLARRSGWNAAAIGLRGVGEGGYVVAPPTRVGGAGAVQWARCPTTANRWLPEAAELIGPLAYACGRVAADAREALS
ncbi:bifunctional DNA primase/polymerase [Streptomyces sp. NPDC013181]|uniref:bifunctional DNA primase/polymerase n=1 Tax=unclassified Streptomyces TaxID=2593676 RepID=UPI00369A43C6